VPLDFNLLPPEYRRPFLSPRGWLFLILAVVAFSSLLPILQLRAEAGREIAKLEKGLKNLSVEERRLTELEPKVKEISNAIKEVQTQLEGVKKDYEILSRRGKWYEVLEAAVLNLPEGITVTSAVQRALRLEVKGTAPSLSYLSLYLDSLNRTQLFNKVELISYEKPSEILSFTISLEVKE
jgi:Tfp pilus assembly protein PilN